MVIAIILLMFLVTFDAITVVQCVCLVSQRWPRCMTVSFVQRLQHVGQLRRQSPVKTRLIDPTHRCSIRRFHCPPSRPSGDIDSAAAVDGRRRYLRVTLRERRPRGRAATDERGVNYDIKDDDERPALEPEQLDQLQHR